MTGKTSILTSASPEETRAFGRKLARGLRRGNCVALIGDLGSGKTCLAQGICEGLHVTDPVTSPTFILINEYLGRFSDGTSLPVYHFDLYRLGEPDELYALGSDEYFYGRGVCLIEWADMAGDLLPEETIQVRIAHTGAHSRQFTIIQGG